MSRAVPLYVGTGLVYRMGVSFSKRLGLLVLVAGCAGAAPGPAAPAEAKTGEAAVSADDAKPRHGARPARLTCDDGSCFPCGEAACLAGFFCAVGRRGHGCAWTPGCATKVTCACLASTLRETPGCTCEERDGGVYVTCDGAIL